MAVLEVVPGTDVYLWKYIPSLPGNVVFAALWTIMAALVGYRMFKTKTWFVSAFFVGLIFEIIGYCSRVASINNTGGLAPYIIQATFVLIPPAFFAATIYMILGRIIRLVEGEHLSIIRPQIVTKVFVTGDVLSFMVQGNASGLLVHDNLRTIAEALIILGLAIQLVSFSLFAWCAVIFHMRFRRSPTARSHHVDPRWVRTLWMLYAISVLIVIRSIFRIIEFAFGDSGYPLSHEWTLYVFDSVPMILVTIIFFAVYPSNLAASPRDEASIPLENQGSRDSVKVSEQSLRE